MPVNNEVLEQLETMRGKLLAAGGTPHKIVVSPDVLADHSRELKWWCDLHAIELRAAVEVPASGMVLK